MSSLDWAAGSRVVALGLACGFVSIVPDHLVARDDIVVQAAPRTFPISVDGRLDEWPQLMPLEKAPSVAAVNDGDDLSVVFSMSSPELKAAFGPGLVVWFDGTGSKKESFGLQLPGAQRGFGRGSDLGRGQVAEEPRMPPTGPERPSSPSLSQIDVLGPGKLERHLVDVLPGHGLAFASGDDQGSLVYELRIPLRKTDQHPYAVSAAPGGLIALQIASPELGPGGRGGRPGERGGFRGGVGGGGRGGQMGGGGGRGGSGAPMPGRGGPDEPSARPKPVKLWFKLQLVRTPA